jgi:hypothetical protein
MFFLSDYDVSEYRKLGAKDKTPRKRNWKKILGYGALGIGGLAASGLLLRRGAKNLHKTKNVAKSVQDNIPTVNTTPTNFPKVPQQPSSGVYKDWSEEAVKKNLDNPDYVWEL